MVSGLGSQGAGWGCADLACGSRAAWHGPSGVASPSLAPSLGQQGTWLPPALTARWRRRSPACAYSWRGSQCRERPHPPQPHHAAARGGSATRRFEQRRQQAVLAAPTTCAPLPDLCVGAALVSNKRAALAPKRTRSATWCSRICSSAKEAVRFCAQRGETARQTSKGVRWCAPQRFARPTARGNGREGSG